MLGFLTLAFLTVFTAPAEGQSFVLSQSALDVDPGDTVLTGNGFRYRINYRCNSVVTDCTGAVLTWSMPPELVFVSALGTTDIQSIATPGVGSNGPVTFTFDDPVPAGNTGDLDITVRFPNGSTPDGTVTTGTADNAVATGTNFPDAMASAPVVTAVAGNETTISKSILGGQAFLDQNVTYRVRIDPDGSSEPGSLNLTGVVVTDSLPVGATFVSANNGGVYDAMAHTVTWDNGGAGFSVSVGSQLNLDVTVVFPSATFTDGEMVTNSASAMVTPLGEPAVGIGPADLTHPVVLFVESPASDIRKTFGGGYVTAAIGQDFLWNVRARNTGNIPLDSMTVTDTVPIEVDVVRVSTGRYSAGYTGLVTITYSTNLGGPSVLGSSTGDTDLSFNIPALGAGEYVTEIVWSFAGPIPVGMDAPTRAQVEATVLDPDNAGNPVSEGDEIENCLDQDWTATTMSGPAMGGDSTCHRFDVSAPYTLSSPSKNLTSGGGPYLPGQTVSFRFDLDNQSQASAALDDPVIVDLLPAFFSYQTASYVFDDLGTGVTVANFEEIADYAGTGRTLLRWTLSGSLAPGESVRIDFDTTVEVGAVAGQVTNQVGQTHDGPELIRCGSSSTDSLDLDGDTDTTDTLCVGNRNVTIASVAQLESQKLVRGQCDVDFNAFPDVGQTVRGGTLDYRLRVTNVGTVPTTSLTLIDILPFIGDTGVLDPTSRETAWRPLLIGPISAPPGATVFYSTSSNPCRPEVGGPTVGCDAPGWSTVPPVPITSVQAFKVEFGGQILDPLDTLLFELRMIAPADAPIAVDPMNPVFGEIAWNSFAFGTDRVDGGFLNAEPIKVGIIVKPEEPAALGDYVWIDTDGDGLQDDGPTGVNDVPVTLWSPGPDGVPRSGDDVEISSTITSDDLLGNPGWYLFSGLAAGDYYVSFEPPPNFEVTLPDQGASDALDSDADPITACTPVVSLGVGETDLDTDLGLLPPATASLGNYVWFDSNSDGVQNEAVTSGVNGVVVELFADADGDGNPEPGADDGPPIAVASTDDDTFGNPGYYLFDLLPPGGYFVRFQLPAGASGFTTRDAGADDAVDSDADTGTGTTPVTVLAAGDADLTLDAGLVQIAGTLVLGNQVWCDDDGDGIYEPSDGEEGVNGVRLDLYLDANSDGLPQPGEFFAATLTQTLAGNDGRYRFSALPAGDFIVVVVASNFTPGAPLEGKVSTTGNDPAPDPDDDVNGDDNGRNQGVLVLSDPVTLSPGTEPTDDGDGDDGNQTVDFGFETGMLPPEFDYGDAPDAASGTAPGDYPTRALDAGPFHALVVPQPFLGDCVDSDDGTQEGPLADRDDAGSGFVGTLGTCAGPGDDEDGVAFSNPLMAGAVTTITVSAGSVGGSLDCQLDAWVDWNKNGIFGDSAGEAIAASTTVSPGTPVNLTPMVPAGALPGLTYARFRCSSAGGLDPVEPAADGEVEDYLVRVLGRDFGDAPASYGTQGPGAAEHVFDPGVDPVLGFCVDAEADGQPNATADGDDLGFGAAGTGLCGVDEDGVSFGAPFAACRMVPVTVVASLPAALDAWVDFDGDGTFDVGDQVFASTALAAGANNLVIDVPCDAAEGTTYARFRLSNGGGLGPVGMAPDGEVEDYLVEMSSNDFGDAPDSYGTTFGAGGPHHVVIAGYHLGAAIDVEADGLPSSGADGDDLADADDEDGVSFPGAMAMITACESTSVDVVLTDGGSLGGVLDAWVDFDGDGAFDDPRDRIATGVALSVGSNTVNYTVPCDAGPALSYARFRLSSAGVAGPGGAAPDGEVEDYAVTVKGLDFGDAPDPTYPTLLASNGARHAISPVGNPTLGALVDGEGDGQPSPSHNGDDGNGVDDEDGVVFPAVLIPGTDGAVEVTAGAVGGLVSVWIDFNQDGDWGDAGEQIVADVALVASSTQSLTFPVPVGSPDGSACARFRLSSQAGLSPTGAAPDGEIEDHLAPMGVEEPAIGIAKELLDVVREGTETTYLTTFEILIENTGNVPLSGVGATADLAVAFSAAVSFEVVSVMSSEFAPNPLFDGEFDVELLDAGNTLGVGESGRIELVVRVDPGTEAGPYFCSSIAQGTSPEGNDVTDMSQNGPDPDADNDGDANDDDEPTPVVYPISVIDIPVADPLGLTLLALLLAAAAVWKVRRGV